jgi:hypothetical protein
MNNKVNVRALKEITYNLYSVSFTHKGRAGYNVFVGLFLRHPVIQNLRF